MELEPKVCPDCEKEGNGLPQEVDSFYVHKRKKKDGSFYHFQSTYCKRHQTARNTARQTERLSTSDKAKALHREASRRYRKKYPERAARTLRNWRKQNPERASAHYRKWAENNPTKRRNSQVAWYKRKKRQQDNEG